MSRATPLAAADAGATGARVLNPVALVACKEWLDLWRDQRWRALAWVCLALSLGALLQGLIVHERAHHQHDAAEQADRRVWTAQGAKNPHAAAHFGQYAFKPAGVLALADPGVDAYAGSMVWMEAHKQNDTQFRAARDASLVERMGRLTLAFVWQTVLPLVALLLGHAAMAGERSQGTLRPLLAQGLAPWQLLAGKLLALGASLLGLLAITSLGLWGLALAGDGAGTAGTADLAWRLTGMALAYAPYLLGFALLALALAAWLPDGRSALLLLLGFWLLNSFVAPRWASDHAAASNPLPSALAFRAELAADKKKQFGHDDSHPAFAAFKTRVLAEYGVQRIEDLPVSFRGLSLRADDEAGYRIYDAHFGRLQARIEQQDRTRAAAGWLLPMLALQPVSMAMAGTDNRHHHHFVQAAEAHRRRIQTAASDDLIRNARPGDTAYAAAASLWLRIPALQYTAPGAAWAAAPLGHHYAALWAWCALCGAGALLAARHGLTRTAR